MNPVYYNDNDLDVCAWLRELIKQGHLREGDVDERSIVDVDAADLRGYAQVHFFAGIGGWPLALELAGWPEDRPVWTGSCPCQPLSVSGQRKGHADERHLWPAFYALITKCRPPTVFGEQVAGNLGREWLAAVRADLEAAGYACGAADLPACSVGAPQKRSRIFWVADAIGKRQLKRSELRRPQSTAPSGGHSYAPNFNSGRVADADNSRQCASAGAVRDQRDNIGGSGSPLADLPSAWTDLEHIICADGNARLIEPGVAPLAHGLPARMVRLRGYGNAIVPQVAAAFVKAVMP